MPPRLYKALLTVCLISLLILASSAQRALNRDRAALGVTRGETLGRTAPPVLVFTTVALGGFRGLIANALWVRAMDLQEQDKYFEKVQLADWITKLQPHFVSVWVVQAWDMAYNISVKLKDHHDRWLWVQRGIELLRDQALQYNPDEPLIYRELAWFFQHKLGADLDDAHFTYKYEWATQMQQVLGTNYLDLVNPQSDDARARARILRERYKLDPEVMREIDESYGPLEWRLPEAHAIYWSTIGFKKARKKDLITLRRTIYQPMQLAFQRGRLVRLGTEQDRNVLLGPNLAMIPRANDTYLAMAKDDAEYRDHILRAHRNFLKDAVYFLYSHNRRTEAERWYRYLLQQYPDAMALDARRADQATVRLADLTVDEYAAAKVTEDIGETSNNRVRANILGFLITRYYMLAIDEDDAAEGHRQLALVAHQRFQREISRAKQEQRIALPPFAEMERDAFNAFEESYNPDLVARLRTRLGLPPRAASPSPSAETPALPGNSATNAPR